MHAPYPPSSTATDFPPLPPGWRFGPALVLGIAALAVHLAGINQTLFSTLNTACAALAPASVWAALTLCASGLGALAFLAPTLKTRPRWLSAGLLMSLPLWGTIEIAKAAFDTLRPAGVLPLDSFHQVGVKLYLHAFPSGHSCTAFLVAALLVLGWPTPAKRLHVALIALPWAGLVALSRIAVGAHWPVDVLGGAALGWLAGGLGLDITARWRFWEAQGRRPIAALVMGASLALLFIDLGYPEARLFQIALASWGIGGAASALGQDLRKTR